MEQRMIRMDGSNNKQSSIKRVKIFNSQFQRGATKYLASAGPAHKQTYCITIINGVDSIASLLNSI